MLTQHNDISRTGQNTTETILTPANVSSGNFGLLASLPIDGSAYAQPLYISSLKIGGINHSVVFVATEHDSVYAFDSSAAGQLLWKASLLDAAHGASANAIPDPVPDTGNSNVNGPEWGITGTPVIDPGTNTLYVVSKTLENQNGTVYPVQRLHALDATSGAEKFGGPVTIQASVAGTAQGSVNGTVTFDAKYHMQRPGLLLLNGTVYLAFGSMGDLGIWHGWVIAYNASTLAQTAVFNTTPNGGESGIWLSGAGLPADNENGVARMFVPLGNGSFDATTPYANGMDYGNDIITLNLNNGITVTDAFTPTNQLALAQGDWDVGSGGLIVLPDNMPGASVPREAVNMSKAGMITVLNRDNLGGYNSGTDQVLQEFNPTYGNGLWGMPAYWNGNLYVWPSTDSGYNLQQYRFTNGLLGTTPYATATPTDSGQNGQFLGASPSVSSNGTSNGIVWVDDTGYTWNGVGTGSTQILYALDATNVANTLWSSAANPRDNAGTEQKFAFPTIADGKVYLASTTNAASSGNLLIYGLLDLSISAPSTGSVNPGNNIVIPLSVTTSTSFTQGIGFSATGLPTGVSVSFMQTAPGVEAAIFTAAANAAAGISTVTITGTRGTTTATTKVALQVGSAPDFLLSAVPQTANLGTTGYSAVTVTPQNGFAALPTYSVTGVPAGVTASLSGCSATGCTLLTTIPPLMSPGSYPITVQAVSGSLNHLSTTTLTVSRSSVTQVNLSSFYNINAITSDGTSTKNGGFDGQGYAFSNKLLGGSIGWAGTNFTLGPADAPDAVSGQTVTLPAGNFVSLQMIASSQGAWLQPIVVTYTDGSTSTFSQTFTNWGVAGNYSGESTASVMSYRVTPNGTTQAGPWYLFGYSYPLNSAKTVASVSLPSGSVRVLAMALSSSTSVPQAVQFAPIQAQQAGTSLALNASSTSGLPESFTSLTPAFCAVSGATMSATAAGTCTVAASQPGNSMYASAASVTQSFKVTPLYQATVNLGSVYNINALANSGTSPTNGGFDGSSYAFPANLLGTSVGWGGSWFTLGSAGVADAVSSVKVPVPAGSFSSLQLLASGAYGNQTNQAFVLTYSDGTTSTVTQSFSDWGLSSGYPGESIAASAAYRVQPNGTTQNGPWFVFGYSLPVNPAKTLASVTLPNNRNLIVLAMTLSSTTPIAQSTLLSSYQAAASLSGSFNINAITNQGVPAANGGFDGAGYGFASNLLPYPASWAGSSFTFGNASVADAVSSTKVPLPSGSFSSLQMLASGAFGIQTNQPFIVNYSDGTIATLTQSFSDWGAPSGYPGEAQSLSTSYRVAPDGTQQAGPWLIFGYSFPINSAKTPVSLTLPNNRNVIVFALTLSSAAPFAQTISFSPIASQQIGVSVPLTATASSGLAVSFSSATPNVCTVAATTATTVATGTCTLVASQTGNNVYPATSVSQSFSVMQQPQTVAFASIAAQTVNAAVALSATASSSLPVTFASSTPAVCTVSGATASLVGGGTCTLIASQAGSSIYAAVSTSQSFTVNLLAQTVAFNTIPTSRAGGSVTLTATASSALPITYSSSTTSVCTVAGSTASLLTGGTCTIVSTQAGSTVYAASTVSQSFTVAPPPVVVPLSSSYNVYALFNNGTSPTNGGFDNGSNAFPANLLGTSATWNGAPFTLGGAGIASAVSSAGVPVPAGSFSALQVLASAAYGQQSNQSFVLTYTDGTSTTLTQSLSEWGSSNSLPGELIAISSAYRVRPSGTSQNGPWMVYGYSFPVNSAKTLASVTLPNNRSVIVFAMTLTPSPIAQTITFGTLSGQVVGTPVTLAATASSGLPVTYASSTTSVCTVTGTAATFVAPGTCTLTASQAGNSSYSAAAAVTQSLTVTSR